MGTCGKPIYVCKLTFKCHFLQVEEDASETHKKKFVDFKNVIWHESFLKILESIKQYSKTGCKIMCGDGVERVLFPFIFILSADYEEQ